METQVQENMVPGRPSREVLVSKWLASGDMGRHKVYAAVFHPLKNRTEYAAARAGLPAPEVKMLPEADFWALIGTMAAEAGSSEMRVLIRMMDQEPDVTRQPAHPFLMATPAQETTCG